MTPYQHVTRPVEPDLTQEKDVVATQARLDWLASTETQRLLKSLLKESDSLVGEAIGLALTHHQSDNTKQIVQKLVEANTLRKVVKTYVS